MMPSRSLSLKDPTPVPAKFSWLAFFPTRLRSTSA